MYLIPRGRCTSPSHAEREADKDSYVKMSKNVRFRQLFVLLKGELSIILCIWMVAIFKGGRVPPPAPPKWSPACTFTIENRTWCWGPNCYTLFSQFSVLKDCPIYHLSYYNVVYNNVKGTVWRVIFGGANFCGKLEMVLRLNFHGFKFHDSNPIQGRAQTMM